MIKEVKWSWGYGSLTYKDEVPVAFSWYSMNCYDDAERNAALEKVIGYSVKLVDQSGGNGHFSARVEKV